MAARVPQTFGRQPPLAAQADTTVSAQTSAPMWAQVSHRFSPPSPLLSTFVASFWVRRSAPHARSLVLPTGTAQLIVDLSGDGLSVPDLPWPLDAPHPSSSGTGDTCFRNTFPAMLHGADTLAYALETDRPLFQVGVDFKAGGAYPFFAPPASVLQNAHLSLDALWSRRQVAELRDRLVTAQTQEECARLLAHTLLRQLVRPLRHHPAVALALRLLSGPPHPLPEYADAPGVECAQIGQVAEAAGLSAGHLTRHFQEEVGLTPKHYARVRRFQAVLRRAHLHRYHQWREHGSRGARADAEFPAVWGHLGGLEVGSPGTVAQTPY